MLVLILSLGFNMDWRQEDKFIINYERNINSSLLLSTQTQDNVGNEANADRENQERDVVGLEMKLAQAKTSLGETSGSLIRRVDHLLEYFRVFYLWRLWTRDA